MTHNRHYEVVVKRINDETGLSVREIKKLVEEKVKVLGGRINLEYAARIIAVELGMDLYNSQRIQSLQHASIRDLFDGMNNVTIIAKIKQIGDVISITVKDGTEKLVQKIHIKDETGFCRLVLLDDQIRQFYDNRLMSGDKIKVNMAFVIESEIDQAIEIYLSSKSHIEKDPKDIAIYDSPIALLDSQTTSSESLEDINVDLSVKQKNSCFYCGLTITSTNTKCSNCGMEVLKCSVCKLPVFSNQVVGKCSLCGVTGHLTHMQEWVKVNGKCASCLQELPVDGVIPLSELEVKK